MPVQIGKDKEGCFARFGNQGAKYYYDCGNDAERIAAKQKAINQGLAAGELKEHVIKRTPKK